MFTDEKVEQILEGIAWLNNLMGIWSLIIPIVFVVGVLVLLYWSYKDPSRKHTQYLLAFYALIYIYSGSTILLGKDFMGLAAALGGAIGLWSIAVLLILDIIFNWTEIVVPHDNYLKSVSWFLIFAGIFIYPLLELALGFHYPGMVFFGAECPTTISLIGLLIGSIPRTNKILLVLVSLNAIATGGSVAIHGAGFDYLYAFAGVLGVLTLAIYFKQIFSRSVKV